MSIPPLLLAAAVAALLLIGLLSGYLGIGGGFLIIPVLELLGQKAGLGDVAIKQAMGTTLVVSSLTALSGFLVHRRSTTRERSPWPLAVGVGLAGFVGGQTGARLGGATLAVLFGSALVLSAALMAVRRERGREDEMPGGLPAFLLGLPIGFCASIVGLGGAVFTGLVFSGLLGFPIRRVATATSLAQVCGGTMGWIGWATRSEEGLLPWSVGYVHFPTALVALVLTWPLARIGARWTHRTPPRWARWLYAALLLLLAARFLVRGLG
jgi:uncharacterized membrane protein YfcA